MAKTLDELKNIRQQMVINLHTNTSSSGDVADYMKESAWTGEIAVQHFADDNAAMWTLGKDKETAVEFISRKTIEGLLASAATLSIVSASPIDVNVREEWVLKNLATSAECGSHIKIYKDSSLVKIYIGKTDDTCDPTTGVITSGTAGNTALCYQYILADGTYALVCVDLQQFLEEHEFKSGVTCNAQHIVHGVVAPSGKTNDNFLFVDGDGFYTSGITEAILSGASLDFASAVTTDTKVKEAWMLWNTVTKKQVGNNIINVYKDQHVSSAYIGHIDDTCDPSTGVIIPGSGDTAFVIVKTNEDGDYELINVNIEDFVQEHEFKKGLTKSGHTIIGVVAPFSAKGADEFLFVDDDGFYTSGITEAISMEIVSAATTDPTVKEAWKLYNSALTKQYGDIINIYKDQHMVEAMIGNSGATVDANGKITNGSGDTAFLISRMNASGVSELIQLSMQQFLEENEVGSGLTVIDHVLRGVVAPKGDPYLFVDDEGFFLSGSSRVVSGETMAQAIAAADKLGHVVVDSAMTSDGTIIYTIDRYDIASNSALTELSAATIESADTLYKMILSASPVSSGNTILVGQPSSAGTNLEVNIDNKTIGKDINGILGTLLLISSVTPSAGIKEEYALMDGDGNEISGSTHIKIGQTCKVSGETMADAMAAADGLGHVTVDSAMTSAGTVIYTIDKYDIASDSALTELSAWTMDYVGSGWVASSITEVIVENERIVSKALNKIVDCISALTPSSYDKTVVFTHSSAGTDYSVNIDNTTIGKDSNGVLSTLLMIASAVPSSTNILEEWRLVDHNYDDISGSSHIKIYKDSSLNDIYLGKTDDTIDPITGVITSGTTGATALCFKYQLADGTYKLVTIDVTLFFSEEIFKKGFEINKSAHTIDVKIDSNSEPYLTVSMDGLKLSGISAISEFEVVSASTTDTTVREAWRIYNNTLNRQYGEVINIYKDQYVMSAITGHMDDTIDDKTGAYTYGSGDTAIVLIKLNASGGYETLKVNIEDFVQEHEFASGITHTGHIVHGVVAPKTDPYLYVDADGFFLSGITGIANVVSGETEAEAIAKADRLGHVVVESAQTGSHVTYTVKGYDVASNDVLMELSAATIESADTLYKMILSANPISSGNTILVGNPSSAGTNLEVNIDNKTIGKNASGVLSTLLLISSVTPSAGIKEEYALMDGDGNEISGSTHIKIGQTCKVSGETMADAMAAADGLGHVTVDSAMTSAGTVIYAIDRYDIASDSALTELSAWTETYVGSGWVASSITEVIIENEKVVAAALNDLNDRISNMNYIDSAITNWYVDEVNQSSGVISTHKVQLPVVEVKNLYSSGDTKSANIEILTNSASTVTMDFSKIRIDCGLY